MSRTVLSLPVLTRMQHLSCYEHSKDQAKPHNMSEDASTKRVCRKNGLVGLFDILGYRVFLEKNSPETAAEKVMAVLNTLVSLSQKMPRKMVEPFAPVLGEKSFPSFAKMVNEIEWLVFSDTVLLTLDLSNCADRQVKGSYWGVFLMQCCSLWRSMFEFGLPLRGAITKGPYLVHKTCFAGKPIVEAHELANDINCAGVVIAASAIEWCKAETPKHPGIPSILHYDYSFPSKAKGFVENTALNVMFAPEANQEKWAGDIRQLVHESFWAHGKSVGSGVPEKIENTERLLRFLKMRGSLPGQFIFIPPTGDSPQET